MVVIVAIAAHEERNRQMEVQRAILAQAGIASRFNFGIDSADLVVSPTPEPTRFALTAGSRTSVYDTTRRINGQPMSSETLSCSWSHLLIYEQLLEDSMYDLYLVVENDAEVLDRNLLVTLLNNLPEQFDLAHIGTSEWYPFERLDQVNEYFWNIQKRYFNNASAYVLSKTGAKKLLDFAAGTVSLPADDLLSNAFLLLPDFAVIVPEVNPMHSGPLGEISTIDIDRSDS